MVDVAFLRRFHVRKDLKEVRERAVGGPGGRGFQVEERARPRSKDRSVIAEWQGGLCGWKKWVCK
jgi:hypothetical protein